MARIAIVGAGAIGGVVASLLQTAGRHELVLCVRRSIRQLVVETSDGDMRIDATVLTQPQQARPVDWVIVATKAYDVAAAALWLDPLCAAGAPVAVLQNGVEHRERFAPYISKDNIVPVIVDCPAERRPSVDGVDHIVQRGPMSLKVPDSALGRDFVELFTATAAEAAAVEDWNTVAWRKLCHNAAGALPALLLQPAGVLRDDAIGAVAMDMVRECIAVGRAEGATLADSVAEEVLAAYRRSAPDSVNSLHADRMAGRPMEVDARNGVIVRLGKKHGIPTPSNSMAVALLNAMTLNRDS
jgi:2-dehydropantoate 2-reductase